jgi:predicted HicB family RNase H-like nuclease
MARKKTEKKMPAEAETKIRPVRLDLTPEVHRLLRLVAADEDVSMAAFARDIVEERLREEAKKRGIKP